MIKSLNDILLRHGIAEIEPESPPYDGLYSELNDEEYNDMTTTMNALVDSYGLPEYATTEQFYDYYMNALQYSGIIPDPDSQMVYTVIALAMECEEEASAEVVTHGGLLAIGAKLGITGAHSVLKSRERGNTGIGNILRGARNELLLSGATMAKMVDSKARVFTNAFTEAGDAVVDGAVAVREGIEDIADFRKRLGTIESREERIQLRRERREARQRDRERRRTQRDRQRANNRAMRDEGHMANIATAVTRIYGPEGTGDLSVVDVARIEQDRQRLNQQQRAVNRAEAQAARSAEAAANADPNTIIGQVIIENAAMDEAEAEAARQTRNNTANRLATNAGNAVSPMASAILQQSENSSSIQNATLNSILIRHNIGNIAILKPHARNVNDDPETQTAVNDLIELYGLVEGLEDPIEYYTRKLDEDMIEVSDGSTLYDAIRLAANSQTQNSPRVIHSENNSTIPEHHEGEINTPIERLTRLEQLALNTIIIEQSGVNKMKDEVIKHEGDSSSGEATAADLSYFEGLAEDIVECYGRPRYGKHYDYYSELMEKDGIEFDEEFKAEVDLVCDVCDEMWSVRHSRVQAAARNLERNTRGIRDAIRRGASRAADRVSRAAENASIDIANRRDNQAARAESRGNTRGSDRALQSFDRNMDRAERIAARRAERREARRVRDQNRRDRRAARDLRQSDITTSDQNAYIENTSDEVIIQHGDWYRDALGRFASPSLGSGAVTGPSIGKSHQKRAGRDMLMNNRIVRDTMYTMLEAVGRDMRTKGEISNRQYREFRDVAQGYQESGVNQRRYNELIQQYSIQMINSAADLSSRPGAHQGNFDAAASEINNELERRSDLSRLQNVGQYVRDRNNNPLPGQRREYSNMELQRQRIGESRGRMMDDNVMHTESESFNQNAEYLDGIQHGQWYRDALGRFAPSGSGGGAVTGPSIDGGGSTTTRREQLENRASDPGSMSNTELNAAIRRITAENNLQQQLDMFRKNNPTAAEIEARELQAKREKTAERRKRLIKNLGAAYALKVPDPANPSKSIALGQLTLRQIIAKTQGDSAGNVQQQLDEAAQQVVNANNAAKAVREAVSAAQAERDSAQQAAQQAQAERDDATRRASEAYARGETDGRGSANDMWQEAARRYAEQQAREREAANQASNVPLLGDGVIEADWEEVR